MLHVVDYTSEYGCPRNYNGSRDENLGNPKIKDNADITNKDKDTLSLDIGHRVSERILLIKCLQCIS